MKHIHTYDSYKNFLRDFYNDLSESIIDDKVAESVIYIYFYARGNAGFFEAKYSKGSCMNAGSIFGGSEIQQSVKLVLDEIKTLLTDIELFESFNKQVTPLDYSYLSINCHIGNFTASFNLAKQHTDRIW